jgi:hypothetical protein
MKKSKKILPLIIILGVCIVGFTRPIENKATTIKANKDSRILKFENENNIDFSSIEYVKSETKKDEKLEDAFAKVYDLKRGVDEIRYYYNHIDLNGDGKEETFVLLVGPSVCGTGGCSALVFSTEDDNYKLVSQFTLVNNPIIVSENKTNGWNNLIMQVSGGGIKSFYAEMKFEDDKYPLNPSMQPSVKSGTKVKGTAIISDDISENPGIKF